MSAPRAVLRRQDQQLVDPKRLHQLELLAQDGVRVRRALEALGTRRYQAMEARRTGRTGDPSVEQARGWLRCLDDLGDELTTDEAT